MKKISKRLFGLLMAGALLTYLSICTAAFDFHQSPGSDQTLLQTDWQQMGGFNDLTPEQERTGCWSTAFAQILFYHKLQPAGKVTYQCSNGRKLLEDLGNYTFDWTKFAPNILQDTPESVRYEMAKYNYFVALAVQKDFGTGSYVQGTYGYFNLAQMRRLYKADFRFYPCLKGKYPYTKGKLASVVEREIAADRPLFFYFMNDGDFGHATVIDGFKRKAGRFMVHLNQGQGGEDTGWYDLQESILREDDWKTRALVTIHPWEERISYAEL